MRRHARTPDPYQQVQQLASLFEKLKIAIYPNDCPDEDFRKLLYAIQYRERFPAKESKSGRRARFSDELLFACAAKIKRLLERETSGKISLLRFVSTYLPILDFPSDLRNALDSFQINLEEARILARINRKNLGEAIKRKPSEIRKEILDSHLKRRGTQSELNRRVKEKLTFTPNSQAAELSTHVAIHDAQVDELLEFNEFDTEHLLWEEIKGLVYLMREVDSSKVDDETVEYILKELDLVKLRLIKFRTDEDPHQN